MAMDTPVGAAIGSIRSFRKIQRTELARAESCVKVPTGTMKHTKPSDVFAPSDRKSAVTADMTTENSKKTVARPFGPFSRFVTASIVAAIRSIMKSAFRVRPLTP